jgi:hypothetical protein
MVYALVSKTNEPKARVGSTPSLGTSILDNFTSSVPYLCLVTQKNRTIAKYRILGFMIIFVTLFVVAFSVLLIQERQQLAAAAYTGRLVIHEVR